MAAPTPLKVKMAPLFPFSLASMVCDYVAMPPSGGHLLTLHRKPFCCIRILHLALIHIG